MNISVNMNTNTNMKMDLDTNTNSSPNSNPNTNTNTNKTLIMKIFEDHFLYIRYGIGLFDIALVQYRKRLKYLIWSYMLVPGAHLAPTGTIHKNTKKLRLLICQPSLRISIVTYSYQCLLVLSLSLKYKKAAFEEATLLNKWDFMVRLLKLT